MVGGQADVLVEVEHLHLVPVDVAVRGQGLEELELGGAGRHQDPRVAVRRDGAGDGGRGLLSRRLAELALVVEDACANQRPSFGGMYQVKSQKLKVRTRLLTFSF